jgi:hypothetical protein
MKVVKFIRPSSKYSPGDIAGFEEGYADALIKVGAAKPYDPEELAESEPQLAQGDEPPETVAEQAPATEKAARAGRGKQ